jgi:hypothetical protein
MERGVQEDEWKADTHRRYLYIIRACWEGGVPYEMVSFDQEMHDVDLLSEKISPAFPDLDMDKFAKAHASLWDQSKRHRYDRVT